MNDKFVRVVGDWSWEIKINQGAYLWKKGTYISWPCTGKKIPFYTGIAEIF